MHSTLREKYSLILAIFLAVTLTFSVFSNAYAASSIQILPILSGDMKLSNVAALDDDDNEDEEKEDEDDDDKKRGQDKDDENNRVRASSDYYCVSNTINSNLDISEEEIKFLDCKINGNLKIDESQVKITDSKIKGNIDSDDSSLVMSATEITGNVHVNGGSVKLLAAVIHGNLECDDVKEYSILGSSISGNIEGCQSDDDEDSNKATEKGSKNGDKDDKEDKNDKDKSNKGQGKKKLKIKAKHDGGSVDIEEDDDNNKDKDDDNIKSFPTDFILEADGGFAIEKGSKNDDNSKRFDDVSVALSASAFRLEGNHIRVSVDGVILLDDTEFELTDGHGIIIFFKNPSKHFFRGIIHVAGLAINVDDGTEKKFHLRALLLPSGDEEEGVWSFVVAPAAKLGKDIRIFRLIGELIELGGTIPSPNPKLDHFVVSTISSPVTAGELFNVTVTAVNSEGKTLKNYDGKARISDLSGTVRPETTPRFDEGVFKGKLNITKSMTSDKLTFTDIASNKKGTSNTFNVVSGSLVKVDLTPSAVTIQPAEKAKFIAKGSDKFGNEISGLTFLWSLSSSDLGSISTSGNVANFTASSAITSEANVTLTATISGGTLKDTSKITISPQIQSPDHFEIENISSPKTAGTFFQITVKAVNATGGTIKTYGGPMTLTDITGSLNMTVSSGFSNGVWTGNVNITKAGSDVKITAKDVANPAQKGTSNTFNVIPGSLAKLDLTPSAVTIQPAQKASFTAKGLDNFGNEISPSGLTFTWSLSSSDFGSIATAGNKANFTAASIVAVETNVTLTAKVGTIGDDSKITINPTASQLLDHFVISEITGPKKAGSSFSLTLTAVGSTGATITSYSGPIELDDTTGTMSIITDNGFSNGVWTGTVNITKASLNVKITVEDKESPSKKGTSNAFDVKAGDLDLFQISEIGPQQIAGVEFSITAKAMDAFGNIITDYNGNVTLSTNDGTSPAGNTSELMPSPYTFNSDDEGQHTFQVKLYNAKNDVTITISGSGKNSSSNEFDVVPSSIAKVIITPHSVSILVGEQLDFKAKAQDAFGNVISGATFSWTLSSSSLGILGSNSGSEVEFTAVAVLVENITGSITATSGSISDIATITVTTI